LSDQSDRFGTTVRGMLEQMRQVASGASASTVSAPASASTAAAYSSSAATTSTAAAPVPVSAAPANASKAAAAPTGPLHATAFPDGSGSVGLPDGWKITAAHAGEVIALGPAPAALHFDQQAYARDPGRTSGGGGFQLAKGPPAIPYDADAATKLNVIAAQMAQAQHKPRPALKVLLTQKMGPHSDLIVADVDPGDGSPPLRMWTQIFLNPLSPTGTYSMTLYQVFLPQEVSTEEGNATAQALLGSYQSNGQKMMEEMAADKAATDRTVDAYRRATAQNQAIADNYVATSRRNFDAQARSFAADDYALLGNTVVRDRDFNEHGLVSDNLADALTQADPNRFQEVPPSEYVKGVDY
jgi:hypothetical protein